LLCEKNPAAGSSLQIKNVDASRIDLFTKDYDERLLSFFYMVALLRDYRDTSIFFL
jgi:hypothetical protein